MTDRSFDVHGPGRRERDDADEKTSGVYRTWPGNTVIAVVVFWVGLLLTITSLVGVVLMVRALRRAVIVTPSGLEARRTFSTWSIPWSAVESFALGDRAWSKGSLTVVLEDGSTRSARLGSGRRRTLSFAEVAAAARRRSGGSVPWPSPSPDDRVG
jgi:hypothetical protein